MSFDKTCGNVTVIVAGDGEHLYAAIEHGSGKLFGLTMEDLRDTRHLIDRALAAAKHK